MERLWERDYNEKLWWRVNDGRAMVVGQWQKDYGRGTVMDRL